MRQRNKSRINKMKQDNEESINISENVNLERLFCDIIPFALYPIKNRVGVGGFEPSTVL